MPSEQKPDDILDGYEGWTLAIQSIRYKKIRAGEIAPENEAERAAAWADWAGIGTWR